MRSFSSQQQWCSVLQQLQELALQADKGPRKPRTSSELLSSEMCMLGNSNPEGLPV